jgi:DNA-binding MarR family transcriptional regulator
VSVDPDDPRNLALLLRQATDSMEWALVRYLATDLGESLGQPGARTLDDVHLLRWLRRRSATVGELAEVLGRRTPTVTNRVTRLEGLGLVTRGGHWQDGRLVMVALTGEGRALVERVDAALDGLADLWVEDLSDIPDLTYEQVGRVLSRLALMC